MVPEPEDVKPGNDAVKLDGTVLYADLADSTGLVKQRPAAYAAEVYKSYLHCASKIIKNYDGIITAFDGDRVMAVFIGDRKNSNAVRSAPGDQPCRAGDHQPQDRSPVPGQRLHGAPVSRRRHRAVVRRQDGCLGF